MFQDPEFAGNENVDGGVTQNDPGKLPDLADLPGLEEVDIDSLPELTDEEKASLDAMGPRLVKKLAELREKDQS